MVFARGSAVLLPHSSIIKGEEMNKAGKKVKHRQTFVFIVDI